MKQTAARHTGTASSVIAPSAVATQHPVASSTAQVIPVGQEPPVLRELLAGHMSGSNVVQPPRAAQRHGRPHTVSRGGHGPATRDHDGLRVYKNALHESQVFGRETMRHLKRSEVVVWLAIHGCQGKDSATISYDRLVEITGTSRKHVGGAIKSLRKRGLLEILEKGRYRPGVNNSGRASRYRVFPKPQARLLPPAETGKDQTAVG